MHIIEEENAMVQESQGRKKPSNPTPIGSQEIEVVEQEASQSWWAQDPSYIDCLENFLHQEGEFDDSSSCTSEEQQVRKRTSGCHSCPSLFYDNHEPSGKKLRVEEPGRKRQSENDDGYRSSTRIDSDTNKDSVTTGSGSLRISASQTGKWYERYNELVHFQQQHGHCLVSYDYKANIPLALWVKRQRHQYKLLQEGLHSTMTEERTAALEILGFVWDSQKASWEERFNELIAFRTESGHCNVPTKFAENPRLATWVKCQRRQYKLFSSGGQSSITKDRIAKLSEIGFSWNPRRRSASEKGMT